ncbi:helix-turn-helix domain-containing protein [Schleiferilactobacillus perolens]|uniref:HTH cro/C1-type domain-containing protein n=1 Tax=Schleiferilactobacillus perolens DSM 12744 TaxID=1423792 RepID=A0A0R1N092_9LACO|nr:helix-turn-helix transcriptional regulator [Schleiferilactobacillus perolens]KRL13712.1 hypothetical protein FD09_GL001736 [Schleiferilactobacillus perolens DSM 12744]
MELGEFFRRQRQDSQLTIHQIAHGIVSDAALSRFERGESEISTDLFLRLLTRLNSNVDYLQDAYSNLDPDRLLAESKGTLQSYRDQGLKYLKQFDETGWPYYRLAGISQLVITDMYMKNKDTTVEMIQIVLTHLKQLHSWGTFEIRLASRITRSPLLKKPELIYLLEKFLVLAKHYATPMETAWNDSNFAYAVIACQGISLRLIEHEEFELARKIIDELDNLPLDRNLSLLYNQARSRLFLAYHDCPSQKVDDQFYAFAAAWADTRYAQIGRRDLAKWRNYVIREDQRNEHCGDV